MFLCVEVIFKITLYSAKVLPPIDSPDWMIGHPPRTPLWFVRGFQALLLYLLLPQPSCAQYHPVYNERLWAKMG